MQSRAHLRIAFGPAAPAFGSWEWVGSDIARALAGEFETVTFRDTVPECDVCVCVKFKPRLAELQQLSQRCRIVYAPVDLYGSAAEIDADGESLHSCDGIVAHCERLMHYFATYAPTTYIDHHLKFIAPLPQTQPTAGPILWVGNHSNLPPLIEWLQNHSLPEELWILTDRDETPATELGIPASQPARIGCWSRERHIEWTLLARAALDIKGNDFRARHKPPTKAFDYVASGLPLAMNAGTSSGIALFVRFGLSVPAPTDSNAWFSREYWEITQYVAQRLRQEVSLAAVAARWAELLHPPSSADQTKYANNT